MAHQTPLYDWHRSKKARMVEFGGWNMPIQYSNITDEHKAVRTGAGIFDISHMGRLAFQGKEADPAAELQGDIMACVTGGTSGGEEMELPSDEQQ